jgi:uncharacterized protein (DUF427 family)
VVTSSPRPIPHPTGAHQESVWDYPRPPRLEPVSERVEVVLGGVVVASTTAAWRVLETSHPPNYYLPPGSFVPGSVVPAPGSSLCEWKGAATYWTLRAGGVEAVAAAWSYEDPTPAFGPIRSHLAVYAGRVDECRVDGEVVTAQPGGFYGGWITDAIVGPFKGTPGTMGW